MSRRKQEYPIVFTKQQLSAMPAVRPIYWWLLGGAVVLFVLSRTKKGQEVTEAVGEKAYEAGQKISALVSEAERAIIKKFVPKGREGYIDATFELGAKYDLDPYLLLGILKAEGNFGAALSKGEYQGHTVYSGDFIPRGSDVEYQDKDTKEWKRPSPSGKLAKNIAALNDLMSNSPLPGVKRVYWERPKTGNLLAMRGQMWVPAHDIRVAKHGIPGAYTKDVNGPFPGAVGWGFTPWALDWGAYAPDLKRGAMWEADYATRVAIEKQIIPAIRKFKSMGITDRSDLIAAIIASYNVGLQGAADAIESGRKSGLSVKASLDRVTASSGYVDTVNSIAKAAGREIVV